MAIVRFAIAAALLTLCAPAYAGVTLSFQSFNGSMFIGRYPHTFIVMTGTLDSTGEAINENYGYSAKHINPVAILSGPVDQWVYSEKQKYVDSANRHFSVPISDEVYHRIVAETMRWRDSPEYRYDLKRNNCIHYVARIAGMVGLKTEVPEKLLRRPRAWLNHIVGLNPALKGRVFK